MLGVLDASSCSGVVFEASRAGDWTAIGNRLGMVFAWYCGTDLHLRHACYAPAMLVRHATPMRAQYRRDEKKKRYRQEGKETARREAKKQKSMH